jgi:hypothetical protein
MLLDRLMTLEMGARPQIKPFPAVLAGAAGGGVARCWCDVRRLRFLMVQFPLEAPRSQGRRQGR